MKSIFKNIVIILLICNCFSLKAQSSYPEGQLTLTTPLTDAYYVGDIVTFTLKDLQFWDGWINTSNYKEFEWYTDMYITHYYDYYTTEVQILLEGYGTKVIYVNYKDNMEWRSASKTITIINEPRTPEVPIVASSNCNQVVLQRSDPPGNIITNQEDITWYWQSTPTGTSTDNSNPTITLTSGSEYFLRAKSNSYTNAWSSSSSSVQYQIESVPPIVGTIIQPTMTISTGAVELSGLPNDIWTINPGNINGSGTTTTITGLSPSSTYNFTVTNSSGCSSEASANVVIDASVCGPSSSENYIHTIVPQIEITDVSTLTPAQKVEFVTYFDGLGRPMQSVGIGAGVKSDGSAIDIITHIAYDDFGRQEKEYLPYSDGVSCGVFRTGDIELATKGFFNTPKYENTNNPYSQKGFEASPLNRVLKQAAPGNDWKLGNGHEIKFGYENNTASEVKNFKVSLAFADNTYTPTLTQSVVNNGDYKANELYKTITFDENTAATPTELNGSTVEFKNKQGQVVLKRTYGTSIVNGVSVNNVSHDTYYVYDDFGNLTFVIPPKAADIVFSGTTIQSNVSSTAVVSSGSNLNLTASNSITLQYPFHAQAGSTFTATIVSGGNTTLDELCYQYVYDNRNRLVEKKLPGKQWQFIIYDKLNRPILTQDANLKAVNKWMFTKYDVFGRVAYTGLINNNNTRTALQNTADGTSSQYVTKSATATPIAGTSINYDNGAFPILAITDEIHIINYYDDYSFDINGASAIGSYHTAITNAKGLATGSKVRVLGTTSWITNVNYYDTKGRLICNYSKNDYLATTSRVDIKLDFVGKINETTSTHLKNNVTTTVVDVFTYDQSGRLAKQTQAINGATYPEVIAENSYDELGQLFKKYVGGKTNQPRLQTVDYTYNIRGWLKGINDVNAIGSDLFAFKINYNDIADVSKKLYNGNISQTFWKTVNSDPSLKNYTYTYDALNRLTLSESQDLGRYNESLKYDKNGNIMGLIRNGNSDVNATTFGTMDNLIYTYNNSNLSNKLTRVGDSSGSTEGFKDGNTIGDDYTYDANGNMTKDLNKGISTAITYNHLNLPTQITFATGNIQYVYDATGVKQEKKVVESSKPDVYTKYAGGYIYETIGTGTGTGTDVLKFFFQPEGYVSYNSGTFDYIYQYKDHLGNVRLSYDKNLAIVEENNYYPFGLKQKGYNSKPNYSYGSPQAEKYKYNGKEYQDELNLNVTAMDYRQYDNAIGRFNVVDPLAEIDYDFSTYVFSRNNPTLFKDPTGLSSDYEDGDDHDWNLGIVGFDENSKPPGFGGGFVTQNDMTSGNPMGGEFKEVEVTNNYKEGYDPNGRIDKDIDGNDGGNDFLDYWNNLNDFNDRIVSPVLGIFEGGAIRASSTISTAKAFNKAALAETLGNVKFLKVAGNISLAGNTLGVGYAAVVAYNNPTNSNIAKLVAQGAIIGIEMGVNAFVPGLGFAVGFGLNALESSDYVQGLYNGLDK